jgi:hypothetical protein
MLRALRRPRLREELCEELLFGFVFRNTDRSGCVASSMVMPGFSLNEGQ